MQYYKKLILSVVLLFICYMILYYLNRISFRINSNTVEGLRNNNNNNHNCNNNFNNSPYGVYNFDDYYSRESLNNTNYNYPVYFDKKYKNFTSNEYNYDDVYDVNYNNVETKN